MKAAVHSDPELVRQILLISISDVLSLHSDQDFHPFDEYTIP